MGTKLSALAAMALANISDVDIIPITDADGAPPTTYGVVIGDLRTAITTPSTDHTGSLGDSAHRWTAAHVDQVVTYSNGGLTVSKPGITVTQTWNASGTAFTAVLVNVTDSASGAASLLADFQVGGASKCSVSKSGVIAALSGVFAGTGSSVAVDKTSVAQTLGHLNIKRSGTSLWWLGSDGSDHGAILNTDASVANLSWTDLGVFTMRAQLVVGNVNGTPTDGSIWWDGTNYKARAGGVTKTITVT